MLKILDYKERILKLHQEGKNRKEIADILELRYHQPIYNFFKKFNLKENKRIYNRKYTLDTDYFKNINTEDKAYILGFIVADGYISEDRLCISLAIKDIDILYKIRKCFKSNQKFRYCNRPNPYNKNKICRMVILQISSREFVKPLLKMALHINKTYTLDKNILKFVPKYLMRHFLRGYFDGDGNVCYGIKYSSGIKYNINICGNMNFLLNSFQIYFPSKNKNKIYYDKKSKQMCVWKLSSKNNVEKFLNYIYHNSNIFLQRKYKIYLKSKHAHIKPI